jgi:hypothetical protein
MDGTQHTPLLWPRDDLPAVIERKVKADGTIEEYACQLLIQTRLLAAVLYALPHGGEPFRTPLPIPPGSISLGVFWRRRPYVVYRFRAPDGKLIGHRLDAVSGVRFRPGVVEFRDLILDWWLDAAGQLLRADDRDAFEAAVAAGRIDARALAAARRAERVALRPRRLLLELARLEQGLGLLP